MIGTRTYAADLVTATTTTALKVLGAVCALSEAYAPYASATLTVANPGLTALAAMDPYQRPRVRLTVTATPGITRTFDLLVSARQLDTAENRVGLNLVGDETVLQDYAPTANDTSNWTRQGSVRAIVRAVMLRALGTNTLGGTADAAFPTFSQVTNLIPNSGAEPGVAPWFASANGSVDQSASWRYYGTYSFRVQGINTANSSYASCKVSASAGGTYTVSAYMRLGTAQSGTLNADARRIQIVATVNEQTVIIGRTNQAPNTANTTTRLTGTFRVPDGASDVTVRIVNGSASGSATPVYFDALMMTEGDGNDTDTTPLVAFDGTVSNTTAYTYTWDGATGASSSTRTPLIDRDPDALTWSIGQTAWDFLTPILQAAGLRLFCDERRQWWLVNNSYAVEGQVRVTEGVNAYSATDTLSRTASQPDGSPLFTDAVLVRFTWRDKVTGADRERWDIAAPTGYQRPVVIERQNTPYPGPGTATYLLSRYKARRRLQSVTAALDLSATPGQQATISLPDIDLQAGYIDTVTWDMGADEMSLTTKALVNVDATSYNQQPDAMTYASLPDTTTYTSFPN